MARYYEILDDLNVVGRWYLNGLVDGAGTELDSREFTYGVPVDLGPPARVTTWKDEKAINTQPPLRIQLDPRRSGTPLDFTFTNLDVPVVTSRVAGVLASVAAGDIQRIPVRVESRDDDYEIINVISSVPCLDTAASEVMWWTEADERPDKRGKARMVSKLVIDPRRVGNHQIFLPEEWQVAIIVSQDIKDAFEAAHISGVKFQQVSP